MAEALRRLPLVGLLREAVTQHVRACGAYSLMLADVFRDLRTRGIELRELSRQILAIGTQSIPIVLLTALFTGMVLALQTAFGLHRFGAKNYVGNVVGLAMVRELAPVLTAIMLCGRVGAGIAAEISSMVASEQVDAIRALGANPVRKLVTPKLLAGTLVTPLLVAMAMVVGIYGGLLVAVHELNVSGHLYYRSFVYTVVVRDVVDTMVKSAIFGFLLVSIACYKGLNTSGGTAVVTTSIVVFVANYFITKLLIMLG
jgi:phospholipid/cholesterol/gamma-HCH transport system permease protein